MDKKVTSIVAYLSWIGLVSAIQGQEKEIPLLGKIQLLK